MLLPGNTRSGWESAKSIQHDLRQFNYLFLVYLLTLGILMFSEIVESEGWTSLFIVHNFLAFFATLGFLVSFGVPFALSAIQKERLEQEIAARQARKTSDHKSPATEID